MSVDETNWSNNKKQRKVKQFYVDKEHNQIQSSLKQFSIKY